MRDLFSYVENYNNLEFEHIQENFRRRDVLQVLEKYNSLHILEVGCGRSSIFNYLDKNLNVTVVEPARDFYLKALNDAQSRSNIEVHNCTLENFSCKNNFDIIVVSSLLHEIHNKHEFILKIKTFMRPNTLLYINVPNLYSFHRLLAFESGLIGSIDEISPTQIRMQQDSIPFSMLSLSELIAEYGFTIIDLYTIFVKPFTHSQMKMLIDQKILNEKLLNGLYDMTKYMPEHGSEISLIVKNNI